MLVQGSIWSGFCFARRGALRYYFLALQALETTLFWCGTEYRREYLLKAGCTANKVCQICVPQAATPAKTEAMTSPERAKKTNLTICKTIGCTKYVFQNVAVNQKNCSQYKGSGMPLERGESNIPNVFNGGRPIELLYFIALVPSNFSTKKRKWMEQKFVFRN